MMNLIVLKEKIKNDLLNVIDSYETKFNVPVFVTSAVVSEIMCEIKSIEMLEMLKGDENKSGKTKNAGSQNDENGKNG